MSSPGIFFWRAASGLVAALTLIAAPVMGAPAASGSTNAASATKPAPQSDGPGKLTPAMPVIPEDYFARYGKILAPNNQPPYPFKLSMPSPGFGELKIPNKGELDMRQKLEQLATLSDAQIRDQLAKWPAFSKMSLADEGAMLVRIQQFRDRRTKIAQMKAHNLGLLTLNDAQKARFEKEYWDKRLQLDRQLAQQFEPAILAAEQKLDEDLFREFSTSGPLAQGPKPPAPGQKPPAGKPAAPMPPDMMMTH